jgi:hypothetical protein
MKEDHDVGLFADWLIPGVSMLTRACEPIGAPRRGTSAPRLSSVSTSGGHMFVGGAGRQCLQTPPGPQASPFTVINVRWCRRLVCDQRYPFRTLASQSNAKSRCIRATTILLLTVGRKNVIYCEKTTRRLLSNLDKIDDRVGRTERKVK